MSEIECLGSQERSTGGAGGQKFKRPSSHALTRSHSCPEDE